MTPVVVKDSVGLVRPYRLLHYQRSSDGAAGRHRYTGRHRSRMKLGTNYPHGPLRWADYLGIDTVLGVMRGLYDEWQEDRYVLRRCCVTWSWRVVSAENRARLHHNTIICNLA